MPELRKDPLIGRWVIVATERVKRPVDFLTSQQEDLLPEQECPFCEGHEGMTPKEILAVRSQGSQADQSGWSVRVVPSIMPLLRIEGQLNRRARGMYDLMNGLGAHEVIVESPRHLTNAADLPLEQLNTVLHTAVARIVDLQRDERFRYALWFKNQGGIAGAGRIAHTRSQIIATPVTPKRVKEELVGARRYFEEKERCLLCDLILQESESGERLVVESTHMIALCPFASRFPFEVWILPKRHSCDFALIQPEELKDLGNLLKQLLNRLKVALNDPPYNYLLHSAPFRHPDGKIGHWKTIESDFHWHMELIPRLIRVAGFEWGSGFYINPTPPEEAAQYLRGVHV